MINNEHTTKPGSRPPCLRPEFSEATHTFQESDEDRAPVYGLLPSGAKANRVFVVGTLTETKDMGEEHEYWRGRVADPVGTFLVYAGGYQPYPSQQLRDVEPPAFVAVVGKPRPFETDTGGTIVSLQPESITIVDEQTRNRWVVETAHRTVERTARFDDPENEYAQLVREQYDLQPDIFRQDAIQALTQLAESGESAPTENEKKEQVQATEPTQGQPNRESEPTVREEPGYRTSPSNHQRLMTT